MDDFYSFHFLIQILLLPASFFLEQTTQIQKDVLEGRENEDIYGFIACNID